MTYVGRDIIPLIAEGHTPANTGGMVDVTPSFVVPKTALKSAVFVAPAVGAAFARTVTFAGTYAVGDEITVTVKGGPETPQKWSKIYRYVVPAGGTSVTAIATAIKNKILADSGAPYTASNVAGVLTVTLKNDDSKALSIEGWTNSSAGTIAVGALAGTISEGNPQDLIDKGIDPADINLASYDTVKVVYEAEAPIGSIDSKDKRVREIIWYGTPGEGANFATLVNS